MSIGMTETRRSFRRGSLGGLASSCQIEAGSRGTAVCGADLLCSSVSDFPQPYLRSAVSLSANLQPLLHWGGPQVRADRWHLERDLAHLPLSSLPSRRRRSPVIRQRGSPADVISSLIFVADRPFGDKVDRVEIVQFPALLILPRIWCGSALPCDDSVQRLIPKTASCPSGWLISSLIHQACPTLR